MEGHAIPQMDGSKDRHGPGGYRASQVDWSQVTADCVTKLSRKVR
jgi:hypothetical protein